jgi:hypothetical protein
MEKVFKVSGREDVLGRLRNIYVKIIKKAGVAQQGKTKYIKCKGEFLRLTTYIKENAKPAAKAAKVAATAAAAANATAAATAAAAGKTVKISKRVSVIANISKIKDIRTRKLLEKTFKKNAKLYFIKDNKRWTGGGWTGGIFTGDITRDVLRNRAHETDKTDLINTLKRSNGVIIRTICNLEYKFIINRENYIIRPYINLKENKIIIELYLSSDDLMRGTSGSEERFWISLPIHISLFFKKNATGGHSFIHITSEMPQLQKYHISAAVAATAATAAAAAAAAAAASNLTVNSQGKTHTYLMADNIVELLDILRTHGKVIFKDWETKKPDNKITVDEYYKIDRHKWEKINGVYSGHHIKSLDILECIDKLDEIFLHIFTTINRGNIHLPADRSSVLLSPTSSISVSAINSTGPDKDYITGSNTHGSHSSHASHASHASHRTSGTLRTSGTFRSTSPRERGYRSPAIYTASPAIYTASPAIYTASPAIYTASPHRPPSRPPSRPHSASARPATRDRSRSRDRRLVSPSRLPHRSATRDRSRSRERRDRSRSRERRDRSRSRERRDRSRSRGRREYW